MAVRQQRLALARAFLKDAPILLLDEPTAHLDVQHEAQIQTVLAGLCQRRTVISIAHRIPTVMRSDLILVLDSGRVVERGTHTHLIQQAGLYARLVGASGEAG